MPEERAEQVYTHASWASDRAASYERLEFLGDSVLELAIARALYEGYPDFTEGRLAKIRSHAFDGRIVYALTTHVDYKTELQETLARRGQSVNYAVLDVEGPPHDRRFTCAAVIDGDQLGVGSGESKKAAEQEAAKEALAKLGIEAPAS